MSLEINFRFYNARILVEPDNKTAIVGRKIDNPHLDVSEMLIITCSFVYNSLRVFYR